MFTGKGRFDTIQEKLGCEMWVETQIGMRKKDFVRGKIRLIKDKMS